VWNQGDGWKAKLFTWTSRPCQLFVWLHGLCCWQWNQVDGWTLNCDIKVMVERWKDKVLNTSILKLRDGWCVRRYSNMNCLWDRIGSV
jgi:hypothetical protein